MRVEILANDRASFVKPMADGLARMLKDCGADARVHYDGIAQMMRLQWAHTSRFPPGPNPYSLIGLNLDDGRLYPDQRGEFQVLVDFKQPRGHFPKFREIQMEALRRWLELVSQERRS